MDQYDYTSELIDKWSASGHLTGVNDQDLTRVAQRLEAAFRRSLGTRGDADAVSKEVVLLQRQGYFPRQRPQKELTKPRRKRPHRR